MFTTTCTLSDLPERMATYIEETARVEGAPTLTWFEAHTPEDAEDWADMLWLDWAGLDVADVARVVGAWAVPLAELMCAMWLEQAPRGSLPGLVRSGWTPET